MFYKFSKGKGIYSVPNGLGDGSAYFDGASSYANLSDSNLPMGNSARSISLWFFKTNKQNEYTNLVRYGTEYSNYSYSIGINDSGCIETYGCNNTLTYNNEPIILGKWYHVVITFNTDYIEQCYLNGILVGTQTHSNINTVSEVLSFANWYGVEWFQGNLKELNVYNRVLSADEVTDLYNNQAVTNGLVLEVPLQYGKDDESMFTSKNFVYDYATLTTSSGFNALGKPISYRSASQAGVAYSAYPVPKDALLSNCDSLTDNILNFINCEVSTDIKKFGKGSIKINSDGYIKFEHDLNLLNTAWTVGHFFYLDNYASGDDWKPLINNDDDLVGTFLIGISSSGYIKWHTRGYSSSNATQLTEGWHHLRITHVSGNTLRMYIDGVFITEFGGFTRTNNTMWIGDFGYGSSYQFNGYIDNIEFFEIPSDKLANYSGETAPVPSDKFSGV